MKNLFLDIFLRCIGLSVVILVGIYMNPPAWIYYPFAFSTGIFFRIMWEKIYKK